MNIAFIENKKLKSKPSQLQPLGGQTTDYMFTMDYNEHDNWHNAQIVPFDDIKISPCSNVFHYGQAIFEGLKAVLDDHGNIVIFRAKDHFERLNVSCLRLMMPPIDVTVALDALKKLLSIEKDWIPKEEGSSLYIRPFLFGDEPTLYVRSSKSFRFVIILVPSAPYFSDELNLLVEEEHVRAVKGGTGNIKAAGNYASSFKASKEALDKGYNQILWLDAIHRKYIEEAGAMNIFVVIDNKIITPSLSGSILAGVTRNSIIQIIKDLNIEIEERQISIDEICLAHANGTLSEMFASGTAVGTVAVNSITYQNQKMVITYDDNSLVTKIAKTLNNIRYNRQEDKYNWLEIIKNI